MGLEGDWPSVQNCKLTFVFLAFSPVQSPCVGAGSFSLPVLEPHIYLALLQNLCSVKVPHL